MIQRLRPAWNADELAKIYDEPHDHNRYGHGHHLRVEATKVLAKWVRDASQSSSVADLSCGNGEIATSLGFGPRLTILGDYAPGYGITGPLEETLRRINDVDIYICSETLEHLDDPTAALFQMRDASEHLVLSTPINAWGDENGEHYYAWDREGVESLLVGAGWEPVMFMTVDSTVLGEPYEYGLWACK